MKEGASSAWNKIKEIWSVVSGWFNDKIVTPVKNFFTGMWDGLKKGASDAWDKIKGVWNAVTGWFNDKIISPVKEKFTGLWDKLKSGASSAWDGIKGVFKAVPNWFKDQFTKAWTNVKNVFSTGGKIFDGIKEGIVDAFKTVVNAIIRGINKVIALPFKGINKVLGKIRDVSILGVEPFSFISTIDVPEIPELAKGGVLKRGQVGLLEGNGAEAVVPLDQNKKWIAAVARQMNESVNGFGGVGAGMVNNSNVNNFTQIINAPKSPSRLELYRQTRNLLDYKGGLT